MRAFSQIPKEIQPVDHEIDSNFPTYLWTWNYMQARAVTLPQTTGFGYLHSGRLRLTVPGGALFDLHPGMYFSCPAPFVLSAYPRQQSSGVLLMRRFYRGVVHVGGPIEERGRLRYIDGCTDSLLIPPQRRGDPCLNLLYFPPGIDQTAHTHPSVRAGMIASGRGRCVADGRSVDLVPGMTFCIYPEGVHKFQTPYDEPMRVIAFHPDSDFGPTDEDHPMLNRTYVEGQSARDLTGIRTGDDVVVQQ